jgi:hypothetical protein
MGLAPILAVTEPPTSLGPPTVVLVHRISDNPAGAPDHLTSSVSVFFTLPKSVSPVTQILQHIKETSMQKQLQQLILYLSIERVVLLQTSNYKSAGVILLHILGGKKPLPINSKKIFLKEDTSSRDFSLGFLP